MSESELGGQLEAQREPELDASEFDLVTRARARAAAFAHETRAITESFAEAAPRRGPRPPG